MRPDARVAICVERGLEMVVGLLAVLEGGRSVRAAGSGLSAGAAALHACRTATPMVLLTQTHLRSSVPELTCSAAGCGSDNDEAAVEGLSPIAIPEPDSIGLSPSIWPM